MLLRFYLLNKKKITNDNEIIYIYNRNNFKNNDS